MNQINNDIYRKLQQEINKMPYGMPQNKDGLDLKLLKRLFTPEEAEIALFLNVIPEPIKKIHKRIKKSKKDISLSKLKEVLDGLAQKGSIIASMVNIKKGIKYYSYALMVIGTYEFQVDRMDKETCKDFEDYLEAEIYDEFHKYKNPQMRPVPVKKSIKVENKVAIYDDVRKIIEKTDGQYAVANCICKQSKDLLNEKCKVTNLRETCLFLPETAWRFIEFGTARKIDKNEALKILDKAEEEGLVIQPSNSKNPYAVCCCCGDCCGILLSAKKFPKPADLFTSNYYASIDIKKCNGCSLCINRCQMEAITVKNKKAYVNNDRCIGCGLCVPTCKTGAAELFKKQKQYRPPKNTVRYYISIMKKKSSVFEFIKIAFKIITGRKV